MKMILANGMELEPLMVTGQKQTVQGMLRDVLTFVFADTVGMDELDGIFTEDACEVISLQDEDGEYLHKGYTIRTELKKTAQIAGQGTSEKEEEQVKRVMVSMAQRTYAESQMKQMEKDNVDIQMAMAELAGMIAGGV